MKRELTKYGEICHITGEFGEGANIYQYRLVKRINSRFGHYDNKADQREYDNLLNSLHTGEEVARRKFLIKLHCYENALAWCEAHGWENWERKNRMSFNEFFYGADFGRFSSIYAEGLRELKERIESHSSQMFRSGFSACL